MVFTDKEKNREQDLEEEKDPEKPEQIGIVVEQVVEPRINFGLNSIELGSIVLSWAQYNNSISGWCDEARLCIQAQ